MKTALRFGTALLCAALAQPAFAQSQSKLDAARAAGSTSGLTGIEAARLTWIPSGPTSAYIANQTKSTVLAWWRTFWDMGQDQDPLSTMAASYTNHDPREPEYGPQNLVNFLHKDRPPGAQTNAPGGVRKAQPQMFAIADGDLVFIAHAPMNFDPAHPPAGVDPGAQVAGNLVRVQDGKIAEEWFFSGAAPGAGGVGADIPGAPVRQKTVQPGADKIDITAGSIRPANDDGTEILYDSGTSSVEQQAANKKLVLDWEEDFWINRNFSNWPKYMKADFRNHDPREPAVGAQALVDWLTARMAANPGKAPKKGSGHPHLFLLADGDLVFIGGSPETSQHFDPKAQIGKMSGNILRIENGKIAEWWFVGAE